MYDVNQVNYPVSREADKYFDMIVNDGKMDTIFLKTFTIDSATNVRTADVEYKCPCLKIDRLQKNKSYYLQYHLKLLVDDIISSSVNYVNINMYLVDSSNKNIYINNTYNNAIIGNYRNTETNASNQLKTFKSDRDSAQLIKRFLVKKNETFDFNCIFTPLDNYDTICFFVVQDDTISVENLKYLKFKIKYDELSIIKNSKPEGDTILEKIAIHSKPGTIFSLNKNEISMGRTGTYELNNKNIKINFLAPVAPSIIPKYKNNDEDDEEYKYTYEERADKYIVDKTGIDKNINFDIYVNAEEGCFFSCVKKRKTPPFAVDYMYEIK